MSRPPKAIDLQIFSVLKRLKSTTPSISIARHIELATRNESDLFYLNDTQFLEILEKYEMENTLDPIADEDLTTDQIIDEVVNHWEEVKEVLLNPQNGN